MEIDHRDGDSASDGDRGGGMGMGMNLEMENGGDGDGDGCVWGGAGFHSTWLVWGPQTKSMGWSDGIFSIPYISIFDKHIIITHPHLHPHPHPQPHLSHRTLG